MKLQYNLEIENPQTHFVKVTLNIEDFTEDALYATIPAWVPGAYEIYDFSRFVRHLHAYNGKTELEVTKKDKSTWKISTTDVHSVSISYEFYANELSVHTSHVDSTHAYFNGINLFMYLEGYKDQSVELVIKPYKDWKISTGLEKLSENRYRAINYDILADCPIEVGTHRSLFFTVDGKEHEVVLYGHGNEDEERIKSDLKKIVEGFLKIFGKLPYKRYVFIYHLFSGESDVMGGLEHLNSTTIDVDSFVFNPDSKYKRTFLSVSAHEFFHLWNVKRIRPVELGPFNYKEENYTTMLWMAEGFTNYYASLILMRTGLIERKEYFKHLADQMLFHDLMPGSRITSAYESSFDTWIKLYKPTPNNFNSYISYYLKGELLGFLLNTRIIEATGSAKSLDDVYRVLMDKFNRDGKGYTEKDVLAAIKDVTGTDFSDFFQEYIKSPGHIDFAEEVKRIGLTLNTSYRKVDDKEISEKSQLGLIIRNEGGKFIVDTVIEGTPAFSGGINPRDELVAVDGFRFTERYLKEIREEIKKLKLDNFSDFKPGDKVRVDFFRRGKLMNVELTLTKAPPEIYEITEQEKLSEDVKNLSIKYFSP